MKDPRIDKLAQILVNFSVKVQKGDRVLIQNNNLQPDFIKALVRAVYAAGGLPFVSIKDISVEREILLGATKEQMQLRGEFELEEMKLNEYTISPEGIVYLYCGLDKISEINTKLVKAGIQVSALEIQNDNLEDFYMNIVGK